MLASTSTRASINVFFYYTLQHKAHIQGNFGKTQSPHTPHHGGHTQGNFEKFQSSHTPQHRAHTQGNYFPYREIFRKKQSFPAREFFKNPQHRDFSWKTNLSSTGAVRSAVKKTLIKAKLKIKFHTGFALQAENPPWQKSFLSLKKATKDFTIKKNEGCTGGGITVAWKVDDKSWLFHSRM